MNLQEEIKKTVIDVPDFPKPGIIFKDITPIFANPELSKALIEHAVSLIKPLEVDVIVGLESRGFPLGFAIALAMNKPFVLIRKREVAKANPSGILRFRIWIGRHGDSNR